MTKLLLSIVVAVAALASACGPSSLKVAPLKIEPIHMVIDVNLHDTPADAKPGEAPDPARK